MLANKQLKIFEPLTKDVFREHTIKEIKENSGEKSNNAISIALKKFKEEGLVKERIIGRSKLYTLNADNSLIFAYIALINRDKIPKLVHRSLELIRTEVEKYTSFYSIAVFGSYSIGEQKK